MFTHKVRELFSDTVLSDVDGLREFLKAFAEGDSQSGERMLAGLLNKTICTYDVTKTERESFYHAFLSGILTLNESWSVVSNRESGDGRADIIIKTDDPDAGIIIELRKADTLADLNVKCNEAIEQIHAPKYDE